MATMKAVRIHRFGGPDVLQLDDVSLPEPGDDELLVRVRAASVNPVDCKTREGQYPAVGAEKLPVTLGRDVSGTVARFGPNVRMFQKDQAVYAMIAPDRGAFSEYVRLKAREAAPKPMRLSHVEAAAVPLAALTAWQGLFDHGGLAPGQRVLIHGGAGGVGHFAVQFAKAKGASVLTTVSGKDVDFVRSLGADLAIDYRTQRFETALDDDVDLVFDLVGGETQARSWSVLRAGGTLVSTLGAPPQDVARRRGVRGVGFVAEPIADQLAGIAHLIDEGRVRPVLAATFPFRDVAQAEERLARGHVHGKIVLDLAA